jgi:hypothetical protein
VRRAVPLGLKRSKPFTPEREPSGSQGESFSSRRDWRSTHFAGEDAGDPLL